MASPRPSKAPSVASSATTTHSASLSFLPRYTPKPDPAYISHIAAAEYVLHNRSDAQLDQMSPSSSPTNESAAFSERSLGLLNAFLDALLYNFLARARGTSLNQLRPAITEVLKAKLARDALSSANEELEDLVSEAELDTDQDVTAFGGHGGWSQDWHLEMAFKRMRMRVMVFIRLGDFDDEDEERFLEEEDDTRNGDAMNQEDLLASPAAVYLAGVLEYIAELCLSIVGDAAFKRASGRTHRKIPSDEDSADGYFQHLVIQEADVEKITLNPTLGRLWRTWRKNYRTLYTTTSSSGFSPVLNVPPSPTERSFRGRLGSLNETIAVASSHAEPYGRPEERQLTPDEIPDGDVSEHDIAANIPLPVSEHDIDEIETIGLPDPEVVAAFPLPMGDNDINEIEVPGLAREIYDDEEEESDETPGEHRPRRPISVILSWLGPFAWGGEEEKSRPVRPMLSRLRSSSAPGRQRPAFMGSTVFDEVPPQTIPESVDPVETADKTGAEHTALEPVESRETVEHTQTARAEDVQIEEIPNTATAEASDASSNYSDADSESDKEIVDPMASEQTAPKAGVIAGATAGAAALVGSALAYVAGTKTDDEMEKQHREKIPTRSSSPSLIEDSRVPAAVDFATTESEKPKTGVSSSIADRRRLFESKDQNAKKAESPVAHQEASPTLPSAPIVEEQVSPSKSSQPPSSLRTREDVTAAVAAAAAASTMPVAIAELDASTPTSTPSRESARVAALAAQEGAPRQPYQTEHDERAIGLAKTSDVPIHHNRASSSVSPSPDSQRSYHLPGQARAEQGRASLDRNAQRDPSLAAGDESQHPGSSKTGLSQIRAATKPAAPETHQNGNTFQAKVGPQAVTFFHDEDEPEPPQGTNEASKHRPPPLQTISTASLDSNGRPSSSQNKSATSTPGGHSTKGSGSSSNMQRQMDKKSLEESRQRDFDSLLKNNEPVKYTLTPEDLRTTELRAPAVTSRAAALADRPPPSPRIISSPNTYPAKRTSPPHEINSTRRDTPSPSRAPGSPKRKPGVPRVSEYRKSAAFRSLTSKPEPMNTNVRRSGFLPREPRVVTDATNDLADYMRSTRPTAEHSIVPFMPSTSDGRSNDNRISSPVSRGGSRSRLVPREPDVSNDGTSELIDFIRQGPPGSGKEQRRNIAPFRTTKDSDEMNHLDFSSANASSRYSNTQANSRAGAAATLASGGPQIVKKQRRVRDPYAIDSDDDDDFLTSLPGGGRAVQEPQEESLADFLRNSEPPSYNAPQTLNGSSAARGPSNGFASSGARPPSRPVNTSYNSNYSSAPSQSGVNGSGMGVPMLKPKFEARAAGATRNGFGGMGFYYSTNDMADFLKSSGPVENMAPSPSVPGLQKKPSKRGRLGFGQAA